MGSEIKQDDLKMLMFNPFKMWKNMYFTSEEALTSITRKAVETTMFATAIDLMLNNYLQYLKLQNELSNMISESLPFSSHRDTARVAKMVISLENKLDRLEDELFLDLSEIKDNTANIMDSVSTSKDEALHESIDNLAEKINRIETAVAELKASLLTVNEKKPKSSSGKTKKAST